MAKKIIGIPTLNGKPLKITKSWAEMNFGQYLRNMKLKDDNIELISLLTGLEYDYLKKAKITGLESVLVIAEFLKTPPTPSFYANRDHIGNYKLPLNSKGIFDVQFESLAQFEDMRQVMNKLKPLPQKGDESMPIQEILDRFHAHTEAYATYCALYLQKIRDGEYDGDKALKMIHEIMNYPASDVIVAGGFFFVRLKSLLNGTKSNSPNLAPHRKKSIGKRSRKSSARTRPLTRRQGR